MGRSAAPSRRAPASSDTIGTACSETSIHIGMRSRAGTSLEDEGSAGWLGDWPCAAAALCACDAGRMSAGANVRRDQ